MAVLSDRAVVKPNDAKTLDLADEQWMLMEDMLPVLQPLQNLTALFSQENAPSSSVVYPSLWKLIQVDMAASDDDTPPVAGFKAAIIASLKERFDMTSVRAARHPFVIATVLDPEYKVSHSTNLYVLYSVGKMLKMKVGHAASSLGMAVCPFFICATAIGMQLVQYLFPVWQNGHITLREPRVW